MTVITMSQGADASAGADRCWRQTAIGRGCYGADRGWPKTGLPAARCVPSSRCGRSDFAEAWPVVPSLAPTRPPAACCRRSRRLHCLDLIEYLETERRSVELDREPPVRVVHYLNGEIRSRFPDLPAMIVTAHGDDERRRRAGEPGAAEFITKPVDFDRLKEQLRQLPAAFPILHLGPSAHCGRA
jgi:Response regulator receiver domain